MSVNQWTRQGGIFPILNTSRRNISDLEHFLSSKLTTKEANMDLMSLFTTKKMMLCVMAISSMIFGSITLIFQERIFSTILTSVRLATGLQHWFHLIFLLQQLTVKEGTASYNAWVETPIPVYTKFYFFDMLNPRDLFHKHEKPILDERGPYTFR